MSRPAWSPPPLLDRRPFALEVDETFSGPALDRRLWLPYYLPHWAARATTSARYDLGPDGLRLRIDADQPPWSPEWNGGLRVSHLQTGSFSGPVGSTTGQHRFRPDLVVREAQPELRLYTPRYGLLELTAAGPDGPDALGALWLIGFEDTPRQSGEICVCELFGREAGALGSRVGMGIHPFGDPALRDAFALVPVPFDIRETHTYTLLWLPDGVAWYVDERLAMHLAQSPAYPMQVMLDLYAFPRDEGTGGPAAGSSARFDVARFRGWRPVRGPGARGPAFPPDGHAGRAPP